MTKKPTYAELEKNFKALKQKYDDYMRTTESQRDSHEKFKALFDRNLHALTQQKPCPMGAIYTLRPKMSR